MNDHRLALRKGFRIGEFQIEDVLGRGGFGITYLAADLELGIRVAIKELLPDGIATRVRDGSVVALSSGQEDDLEWALDGFRQEARILANLRHKNIVKVHRLIEANGTAYMVMDFLDGTGLGRALRSRPTPPNREWFLNVFDGILDGLDAVHAKDQMHRDVKPGNVILARDDTPVLLDFGSAKADLGRTITMTSIVSHGYSPFEQYQTKARQGPFTDIYSAAAIFYRAAIGEKPPVATDRMTEDSIRILSREPRLAKAGFSPAMLEAIDRALLRTPAERPQSISAWREEMKAQPPPTPVTETVSITVKPRAAAVVAEPVAETVRTTTIPISEPEPKKSRVGLFSILLGAATLISLAVAAAIVWFVWFRQTPGEKLLAEARAAIEAQDFNHASKLIGAASDLEPDLDEAEELRQELNREIRISELLAEAETSFAGRNFAETAAASKSILDLDSGHHRARQLLEIAERELEIARHLADAKSAMAGEDFEQAIDAANRALDLDPQRSEASELIDEANRKKRVQPILVQARAAFAAGDLEQARELAESALALDPANEEARKLAEESSRDFQIRKLMADAEAANADEKFDEAQEAVEAVLALDPAHSKAVLLAKEIERGTVALALLEKARAAVKNNDFKAAVRDAAASISARELSGAGDFLDSVVTKRVEIDGIPLLENYEFEEALEIAAEGLEARPGNETAEALRTAADGLRAVRLLEGGEGDMRRIPALFQVADRLAKLTDAPKFKQFQLKAQHWTGACLIVGVGVPHDREEGIRRIKLGVEAGYPESLRDYGAQLASGLVDDSDPARGIELVQTAAVAGDPQAMQLLGWFHRLGEGVEFDKKTAAELERQAREGFENRAANGDWSAGLRACIAHMAGLGGPKSLDAADRLAEQLVDQGSVAAMGIHVMIQMERGEAEAALKLVRAWERAGCAFAPLYEGNLHEGGAINDRMDFNAAYDCYLRAHRNGVGAAAVSLSRFYIPRFDPISKMGHEIVGGADIDKCLELLDFGSERDCVGGATGLGALYVDGLHPEGKNLDKARRCFRQAAMTGDWSGATYLALQYRNSEFAKLYRTGSELPDTEKAIRYLEACADQGSFAAMNELGWLHLYEVPQTSATQQKALAYFKRSAGFGDSAANLEMGSFYDPRPEFAEKNRIVGGADAARAVDYYEKAARFGNSGAMVYIGNLHMLGLQPGRNDLGLAFRYFQRAANLLNPSGITNTALFYLPAENAQMQTMNSVVGGVNIPKAHGMLLQAAEYEDGSAYYFLAVIAENGWITGRPDRQTAINLYRKSSALGFPAATEALRRAGL